MTHHPGSKTGNLWFPKKENQWSNDSRVATVLKIKRVVAGFSIRFDFGSWC
jgi:hypothetical protein